MPKVTVVMPAYNAEKYIGEAIESILGQTFGDYEFIIIDDASTDDTLSIIQEYAKKDERIVVLKNEKNMHVSATANKGMSVARGEYIARMDADDISMPERFEKQVRFLDANPVVGIVGSAMSLFDHKRNLGIRRYSLTDAKIRKRLFRYNPFGHPTVMMRKDVIFSVGNYDLDAVYAEDYDLYFRIGKQAKFANLADILVCYRVSPSGITVKSLEKVEKKTIEIRKKAVEEYGYTMSFFDKIYGIFQRASLLFIRGKVRVWLFRFFRDS